MVKHLSLRLSFETPRHLLLSKKSLQVRHSLPTSHPHLIMRTHQPVPWALDSSGTSGVGVKFAVIFGLLAHPCRTYWQFLGVPMRVF